jgi:tRNA modification GTPase
MLSTETIFALATPFAKSGVAIVRISGSHALVVLRQLTRKESWPPNQAAHCRLHHPATGELVDEALAIYFAAPRSFTGEDVAELHVHGSPAVIRELLGLLAVSPGLRPAEAGEFTRRAFLNGKMDLLAAEGLADLIEAETAEQKRQSQAQMRGEMSRYFEVLRTDIIRALAHLEAYIDFPEEDIPESVLHGLKNDIDHIISTIRQALDDGRRGERLREGLVVAVVGAPNAGKSSLINAIAGRDAAIVSPQAGTTRDVIEIHKDIAGFPVTFLDTAGLRDTSDAIEGEGVRRALARAAEADIKLVLFDATRPADAESLAQITDNTLIIFNKIDILPSGVAPQSHAAWQGRVLGQPMALSAASGQGVEALLAALAGHLQASYHTSQPPLITRARHRALLEQALARLSAINLAAPLELSCEELRQAAVCIGKITGKISVDDVLDVVFSTFCIGK